MPRESQLPDLGPDVAESSDPELEPPGLLGDLVLRGAIIVVMLGTLAFVSVRAYGSVDDTSGPATAPSTTPPPPTITTPRGEPVPSTRATIALEAVISVPDSGLTPEELAMAESEEPEPTESSTSSSAPATSVPETLPPEAPSPETTAPSGTAVETTAPETSSPDTAGVPTTTAPTTTSPTTTRVETTGVSAPATATSASGAIGEAN